MTWLNPARSKAAPQFLSEIIRMKALRLTRLHLPAVLAAFALALGGLPWVLRERRVVSDAVERQLCALDAQRMSSRARRYL